ncbi:DNA helicase-2/ATP-dependent DNA helicase PcrA [Streptomyces avidinii]|uniref:UvrD-helicase domain-containing protein n=1 Tax=Streptomyces sp. NPDC058620 TaxID=3346560 RepID=UPI000BC5B71D|nr:DNA helicase-2/ATP-dependent DNA helicase PcrA [Streptomyces avidinii]SNX80714.1 DNA helicase-2 / ATP-dependent DNA helicase PcrA [Streptomyces microflavus]
MTYTPKDKQIDIITSTAPVVVVLGGAGTGKTTTAVAAARRHLERADEELAMARRAAARAGVRTRLPAPERALFLSFSRTAVAQIIDRAAAVIGPFRPRLEVSTFHGFAWRVIRSFGPHHGYPPPQTVLSKANSLVAGAPPGLTYDELIPAATELLALPKVRAHYRSRYGIVICDEFQDTDAREWDFLQLIAPPARRILLGDANQCIYTFKKGVDATARISTAMALPGASEVRLPPASFRDPSGMLPAAAEAARRRDFSNPAIRAAAEAGRLSITRIEDEIGHRHVLELARQARSHGDTVSIFTHTNAATTELSDALTADGLAHEQVGFTEAYGEALPAQLAMVQFALGNRAPVLRSLAVYVSATQGGSKMPPLARQILNLSDNPVLARAIKRLAKDLRAAAGHPDQLADVVTNAYRRIGTHRGQETWIQAAQLTRTTLRSLGDELDIEAATDQLLRARDEILVGSHTTRRFPIQVMNLHQTKGREADTTILLLGSEEFYGYEGDPFPNGSKLLYVVMTRARKHARLVVPERSHPLWAPLVAALS